MLFCVFYRLLITFTENPDEYSWKGYLYVAGITLTAVISSLCMQHCAYLDRILNMQIRAMLTTAVYKKVRNDCDNIHFLFNLCAEKITMI